MRPCLALTLALLGTAHATWTPEGRQIERSSTSRTDLTVRFTLRPGEDPARTALACLSATRPRFPNVTWVDCVAYTPGGFAKLSGRIRPCYAAVARWFAYDEGMIRLYLAADDRRYPQACPAPAE
ncbi:hypothetical protein [Deinococcus planocerae]|uniref:hypothetical protein n=1 Tax=Deinococcus planocerae TaxID=1737569 RepID=UPI000C7EEFC3|nr:hypothetical protein [Deinococcus planocerae]